MRPSEPTGTTGQSVLSFVLGAGRRQGATTDAPPGHRSYPMRRRLLIPILLAPLPMGGDRFPSGGATLPVPPGENSFGRGSRLPPWSPTRWNPVWLAEMVAAAAGLSEA